MAYGNCVYEINGYDFTASCEDEKFGKECIVLSNDDSKSDIYCYGSIASGLFTIDKKEKNILYVKTGVWPKGVFGSKENISYTSMYKSKCNK